MLFYLMDDSSVKYRERFAVDSYELAEEKMHNYSGYYIAEEREFCSQEEADDYCRKYNSYEGEPSVHCTCCASGCDMTAFDYNHWNGECAYAGDENEDDTSESVTGGSYTLSSLQQDSETLTKVIRKHWDYEQWFNTIFPNGASSKEEVLTKLKGGGE